jgi:hypothetical protein
VSTLCMDRGHGIILSAPMLARFLPRHVTKAGSTAKQERRLLGTTRMHILYLARVGSHGKEGRRLEAERPAEEK